jgi:hypothetical protein
MRRLLLARGEGGARTEVEPDMLPDAGATYPGKPIQHKEALYSLRPQQIMGIGWLDVHVPRAFS